MSVLYLEVDNIFISLGYGGYNKPTRHSDPGSQFQIESGISRQSAEE